MHQRGYLRSYNDYKRNKKLSKEMGNSYGNGVYYDPDKKRYIRYYHGKRSKCLKKISHRKVRRIRIYDESYVLKDSEYHKVYDYWWELY